MSKNTGKGGAKLAGVLHERMGKVAGHVAGIVAERGEIMSGLKLKLYSMPNEILDKDDYSVCASIQSVNALSAGERVLVIWTMDGEPVVIDRITEADKYFK